MRIKLKHDQFEIKFADKGDLEFSGGPKFVNETRDRGLDKFAEQFPCRAIRHIHILDLFHVGYLYPEFQISS